MAMLNTSKMGGKKMDTLFLEGGLEIHIKEKSDTHMLFYPQKYILKKKKNISTNMNILELFINLKIWIKSTCPAMQYAK